MKTLNVLLAALFALVMITRADAADIWTPGSTKDGPASIAPGITDTPFAGFYFGASINWNQMNLDQAVELAEDCNSCGIRRIVEGVNEFAADTNLSADDSNIGGGVQAGYNFQVGRVYGGPRVTFDYLGAEAEFSHSEEGATARLGASLDWLLTVGGKLGIAVTDRIGIYGHAAWAYGDAEMKGSLSVGTTVLGSISGSDSVNGVAYGVGLDAIVAPNWVAFVEYSHVDLDTLNLSGAVVAGEIDCMTYGYKGDADLDIIKVGLNYKF